MCWLLSFAETLDLGPIPPLEVGHVNHFSVELVWEEALKEANARGKGNGVIKVCLQQKDEGVGRNHSWNNCYKSVVKFKLRRLYRPLQS